MAARQRGRDRQCLCRRRHRLDHAVGLRPCRPGAGQRRAERPRRPAARRPRPDRRPACSGPGRGGLRPGAAPRRRLHGHRPPARRPDRHARRRCEPRRGRGCFGRRRLRARPARLRPAHRSGRDRRHFRRGAELLACRLRAGPGGPRCGPRRPVPGRRLPRVGRRPARCQPGDDRRRLDRRQSRGRLGPRPARPGPDRPRAHDHPCAGRRHCRPAARSRSASGSSPETR